MAFGLSGHYTDYGDQGPYSDVTGYLVIPEIVAWFPIKLVGVKPYAKLGYGFGALTFAGTLSSSKFEGVAKLAGMHTAIGVKWAPPGVPLLSIFAQFDLGFEKSEVADLELNGVSQTVTPVIKDKKDFKNQGFHIGVEIGF